MSESASQGPESLGPPGYGGYHHTVATHLIPTPSSTFKDEFGGATAEADSSKSGLPPFSSFSGEEGGAVRVEGSGYSDNAGGPGSRLLDLSNWDYYNEGLTGRLLERGSLGEPLLGATSAAIIAHHAAHQAQYRPWESKSGTDPELLKAAAAAGIPTFTDAFGGPKLPSFQSQFTSGAFAEPVTNNGTTTVPPSESTPGLPSFHTLTPAATVPPRGYPLVPAPVQAREIPAIQQQLLDERHIQLFHSQPPPFPPGANQFAHHPHPPHPHLAPYHMKPGDELKHFQMDKMVPGPDLAAMGQLKFPGMVSGASDVMPQSRLDSRKKERRKARVSSLESSADSDITNAESSGQVAAVSSTGSGHDLDDGFRRPSHQASSSDNEMAGGSGDKPVKKKRKRCGECVGCQRKDNCGECAPCRNEKSHQICKMRRCEKLTEKKGMFGSYNKARTESKRGKTGRGRGAGYRNKGNRTNGGGSGAASAVNSSQSLSTSSVNATVHDNMMTGIASNDGATSKMDSRARSNVNPAGPPGANVQTTPGAPNASPMVPSGVMPPFYGNPAVAPPGVVPPTGLSDPGGFLPGRDRFPNPVWQQQQAGTEASPGWGSPHFQPPPNQIQPHMEFHQQQGMYQGYQPTGYAPPFDYPQDQRAGYGVQQFASTRPPSSPARFPQQALTPQPSPNNPTVNGINGRGTLNNGQYVDSSPSSASSGQYVNGSYSNPSQQDSSMTQGSHPPSASPAPPGRNSSAGSVYDSTDTVSSQGKPNGPQAGNNNTFSTTNSATTGHPNGVPGYPLPRPQLSSLNSSGYSGNVSVVGDQHPPPNSPCWGSGNTGVEQQSWGEQARSQQQQQHQQQQSPPPGGGMTNGIMFSGQQREQLNTRLKSMILNKQQHQYQQYGQYNQYMQTTETHLLSPPPSAYNGNRENGNENGPTQQHPPEPAPDFLVQGPPQAASEGGLWDWVEGTNSNAARVINSGLNRGRNTTGEDQFVSPVDLPGDVKDFLTGNNNRNTPPLKSNWHSPTVDRATANAVETGIFSSPVNKPKLTQETRQQQQQQQQQQQNFNSDNKSEFHKQIGLGTPQQTFPELDLGATPPTFPTFPSAKPPEEHPKVTVKQESLFPFEMNTSCAAQDAKPPGAMPEMKKERMDVASYLDQQKAAERNKRWSPTPPPPPPAPQQANDFGKGMSSKEYQDQMEKLKNNVRTEVPECNCFQGDKSSPPEPGSFYTHLGTAASLADLRNDLETRVGIKGKELRFEKVCYTGKEGKTQQGCPLAKWIIRRSSLEEKVLCLVKHRQGHKCATAWIVVVIVAWEGVPSNEAGRLYGLLTDKMNRFGLPTTRRCATNEPRTCACQGLDPDTCGASFSFGCSWSMYYNGCKYARSKTVRKFRLSVRSEEQEVEERMHVLSTLLSPLYRTLAPEAFKNQTQFEREAMECRLGFKPGRPFSGVTACMDFCAHSHRDLHNMNNGCTVVVSLTRHRTLAKPDDEQLHVLPLYIMDDTDEFGSKEGQQAKVKSGALENLTKFPCEVRVRSVPLQPCRRHGKKRKEDEPDAVIGKTKDHKGSAGAAGATSAGAGGMHIDVGLLESMEAAQLQSSQVSSTVLDSPVSMYQGWGQTDYHDAYWGRSWGAAGQDCKNPNWWGDALGEMKVDADSTTGIMRYAQYSPSNSGSSPHHPTTPQSGGPFVFPPSWQQSSSGLYQSQSQPSTPTQPNAHNNWPGSDPKSRKSSDDSSRSPFLSPASGGTTICHQEQVTPAAATPPSGFVTPQPPPTENNSSLCLQQQQQNKLPERSMSVPLPGGHLNRYPDRPQSQSWDYTSPSPPATPATSQSQTTPPSPFRVPKARPPSRSNNNNTPHQQQPQQQQQQQQIQQQGNIPTPDMTNNNNNNPAPTYCKGFLKPYPPTSQAPMHPARESWPLDEQTRPEDQQQGWYGATGKPDVANCGMKQDAWGEENKLGGYQPQSYGPSGYPNPAAGNGASATVHGGNPFAALNNYSYSNSFMPPCNLFPEKSYGAWNDASYMNYYHQQQIMGEFAKRDDRAACYHAPPFMYQQGYPKWDPRFEFCPPPHHPFFPVHTEPPMPRSEPIGKVVEICDNEECFKDSQMGGVAIALGHGSVLFECAKQELHCTTALRRPNRLRPARISLVFYQHRNLNRARHGWDEWEEKMRLRKLGVTAAANAAAASAAAAASGTNTGTSAGGNSTSSGTSGGTGGVAGGGGGGGGAPGTGNTSTNAPGPVTDVLGPEELMLLERPKSFSSQFLMRAPTCTTNTVTTLFPMHPCMVTGPYQEGGVG